MPSSISSSNRRLPHAAWLQIFSGGLLIAATFIGIMELRLAMRGFRPSVGDTVARWEDQRRRASAFGDHALILVGSSRSQLDTDLNVLREVTGLEPVQLAIDGSSVVPVLTDLANDSSVTGSLIVDFAPEDIVRWDQSDEATKIESAYRRSVTRGPVTAEASEAVLSTWVIGHMRSYADGATPLSSLFRRVLSSHATPPFVMTLPDRSRLADYRRVDMPAYYYGRVVRELDYEYNTSPHDVIDTETVKSLPARIAAIQPNDGREFQRHLKDWEGLIARIQSRGGRVFVVSYPTSGWIREIHQRLYPRAQFWDVMVKMTSAHTLNNEDNPALRLFICPDGSHLDYRDREPFTRALVNALQLDRGSP